MSVKKSLACIYALNHQSSFLQSPLKFLVAESNDYVSVFPSPECWEAVNILTSLLGRPASFPPLSPLGSLLKPSSTTSSIPSAFSSYSIPN